MSSSLSIIYYCRALYYFSVNANTHLHCILTYMLYGRAHTSICFRSHYNSSYIGITLASGTVCIIDENKEYVQNS